MPILSDNFSGTATACRYLIERDTTIGIINGNSRYTTNNERWRGCAQFCGGRAIPK